MTAAKLEPGAQRLRGELSLKPRAAERLGNLSRCWLRYLRPDALHPGAPDPTPTGRPKATAAPGAADR